MFVYAIIEIPIPTNVGFENESRKADQTKQEEIP